MSYKPKYCCECGEEIDRINWNVFSSRRFCQLCETNYKLEDWLPSAVMVLAVLFGFIGIGSYFQNVEQPLSVESKQFVGNKKSAKKEAAGKDIPQIGDSYANPMQAVTGEDVQSKAEFETRKTVVSEKIKLQPKYNVQKETEIPVYFCGAETKKGTPCSRRVKNGGRCWQHKGKEAMLPQKDLLADY